MNHSVTSDPGTTDAIRRPWRWGRWSVTPVLLLLLGGWGGDAGDAPAVLDAFDLSEDGGVQTKLPGALREVSGLAVLPDGRLFSHQDERAVIYELDPVSGSILKAFSAGLNGVRGDFEGIAVVGRRIFLSTSSGNLLETEEGEAGSAMQYTVHRTGLQRLCEFEGLAYDPASNSLLLPCKRTRTRELRDHLVVFVVRLDSMEPYHVPQVFVPFEALGAFDLKDLFRPSAIEVHPETGRLILVSAQEEAAVELSPEGRLLGGERLHRKTHPQTEGITFLPDGTLVLADEGQGKKGRLTRYQVRSTPEEGSP